MKEETSTDSFGVENIEGIEVSEEEIEIPTFAETEENPYTKKITLYNEIREMDVLHLAMYFNSVQGKNLSVLDWEEKLQSSDLGEE